MAATNELKNGAVKTASAPRRRAKPAFDIPDIAGEPGVPAGWVYREDAPSATQTSGAPGSNRLLSTGLGLLFAGAAPVAFVSLLAIGFVTAPFVLAKSALTS